MLLLLLEIRQLPYLQLWTSRSSLPVVLGQNLQMQRLCVLSPSALAAAVPVVPEGPPVRFAVAAVGVVVAFSSLRTSTPPF